MAELRAAEAAESATPMVHMAAQPRVLTSAYYRLQRSPPFPEVGRSDGQRRVSSHVSGSMVPETLIRSEIDTEALALPTPPRTSVGLKQRLLLCDLAALIIGWLGGLVAYPMVVSGATRFPTDRVAWSVLAILTTTALMAMHNLYLARVCSIRTVEFQGLARSVLVTALVLVGIEQVSGVELPLRDVWLAGLITFGSLATARTGFAAWLRRHRAAGRFTRDLVFVGADTDAVELATVMREHPELGFRICGYVGEPGHCDLLGVPWFGDVTQAHDAVQRTNATGAVVIASALDSDTLNGIVRQLLNRSIRVHLSSGLRGIAQQRFRATPLAYEPLFFIEPASLTAWQLMCKRAMDVVGASIGLILTTPVVAVAALAVKLDSRGPALFRQQRVGRDGNMFTFYKLRTMVVDAESQRRLFDAGNQRRGGPLFKLADDPRVTRVGRFLRASSIDELPQLWNVLRGSMSLVGPRPALPSEVAHFDERLRTRTSVPPGLTGLWQIEARDNPAFGPYRRLDLFYVENWSPLLDIGIIAMTVIRVASRCLWRDHPTDDTHEPPSTIVLD